MFRKRSCEVDESREGKEGTLRESGCIERNEQYAEIVRSAAE